MPSKYFPFDSTFTGVDSNGIPQGDRGANSADWAAYVSRMFTDGYFRLLDGQLEPSISAIPMAVDIAAGSAMIKGRQYAQDETVTVSLGLSDSQPRIDRIVLRMSTEVEDRKIYLKVLKGTPATSPVAPELTRTASVYDICLAQIAVGANAIQIVVGNLTDTRDDDALCGYVKLLLDGRYYPEGSIPELLWVYTMYPETLTAGQKATIESDTELMGIYGASNVPKIGDIVSTLRTDLNDDWLLCNGADINPVVYPELYDKLTLTPDGSYIAQAVTTGTLRIAYGNGYIVAWVNGASTIYYRNNITTGAWLSQALPGAITNMAYINGYWIGYGSAATLYYRATNPAGSFNTGNQIVSGGSAACVAYGNGQWAVGVEQTTPAGVYYASSLGGSWTKASTGATNRLAFINGYWVRWQGGGNTLTRAASPLTASTSWSSIPGGTVYGAYQGDVILGTNSMFVSQSSGNLLYVMNDPMEGWLPPINVGFKTSFSKIMYGDGLYVAFDSGPAAMYAYSLKGPWYFLNYIPAVMYDGCIVEGNILFSGTDKIYIKNKSLPLISGGMYSYIKAK